ncbi:MAG: DMT family transporter [Bacteroidia bacterium]|nr:DMT family transporter [Bacteroidia bacterium]
MWFVAGSILTNVLLLVWLRLFRVPVFPLITLNYWVCVGWVTLLEPPNWEQVASISGWAIGAFFLLGGLFISVFALTGAATREIGIGLVGMLAKLSVVFPVAFSAFFMKEPLSFFQQLGVLIGLGAIVAVHYPYLRGGGWRALFRAGRIGILLWIGNGIIDILFKAFQPHWVSLSPLQIPLFIMSVAGALGVFFHLGRGKGSLLLHRSTLGTAVILGTTNLLSIYCYLKGLQSFPAVQFFLWNNLGIVLLSGIVGVLFFRERFSWEMGVGYGMGLLSIFLVSA